MKLLVCIDGSEQSKKALDKALGIAGGCGADEVTIINVFESKYDLSETTTDRMPLTREDLRRFEKVGEQQREERRTMLSEAAKLFKEKNI